MKLYILVDNGHYPIRAYKIKQHAQIESDKLNRERYVSVIKNHLEQGKEYNDKLTEDEVIQEINGWYEWDTFRVYEVELEE